MKSRSAETVDFKSELTKKPQIYPQNSLPKESVQAHWPVIGRVTACIYAFGFIRPLTLWLQLWPMYRISVYHRCSRVHVACQPSYSREVSASYIGPCSQIDSEEFISGLRLWRSWLTGATRGGSEVTFLTCTTANVNRAQVWDSLFEGRPHGKKNRWPSGRDEDSGFINRLGVLVIGREGAIFTLSFYEK